MKTGFFENSGMVKRSANFRGAILLLLASGMALQPVNAGDEYRSLLSINPGMADIETSAEFPLEWTSKDREGRFRSVFEAGSFPRYESWRTAGGATPEQKFSLQLELKQPLPVGTVLADGNTDFQIHAQGADGSSEVEMVGDEKQDLRIASFSAKGQMVKRLIFSASKVPGKFQNNFVMQRGNDAIDQKLAVYRFQLQGVYLFPETLEDLAPYANVAVDGIGDAKEAERPLISAEGLNDRSSEHFWRSKKLAVGESAEAVLSWDQPVTATVAGCLIPWNCFQAMPERAEFFVAESLVEKGESNWQPVGTIADFKNEMWNGKRLYLFRMPKPQTFRAMKVRFVSRGGPVEIGELLVLGEIKDAKRQSEVLAKSKAARVQAPIPVPVRLPKNLEPQDRFTLVIEDAQGKRIRNLISDEPVTNQGEVRWDGLDEDGKVVPPGSYVARGLVHAPIRAQYMLSPYSVPGAVPWVTKDRRGGWLSDHQGASAIEYLDGKLWIGAPYAEAGDTIIRTDGEGHKEWGLRWLDLDGARHITSANGKIYAGNSGGWRGKTYSVIEVDPATCQFKRILDLREEEAVGKSATKEKSSFGNDSFSGLAVSGDRIYLAFRDQNRIDVYDKTTGKKTGEFTVPSPRGLVIENPESALVISGETIQRCDLRSGALVPVVTSGLTDPINLTLDTVGNIYLADRGANQVFIFSHNGELKRTLGVPGGRKAGVYNPNAFDRPMDVAVDGEHRIWVAEAGLQPKRISVWNPDGSLWREFFGPGRYACGGYLDPADYTRFFAEGMEFSLDYTKGTSTLKSVICPAPEKGFFDNAEFSAERPLRLRNNLFLLSDRHYSRPLYWFGVMRGDRLQPVAAVGGYAWAAKFFDMTHLGVPQGKEKEFTFLWQDENGDGVPQPEEFQVRAGAFERMQWSFRMGDDLSFFWVEDGKRILHLAPVSWTKDGLPRYALSTAQTIYQDDFRQRGHSLIGAAPLDHDRLLLNRKPLECVDVASGKTLWRYRNDWPSNTHDSPLPTSGQLQHVLNIEGTVDVGGDAGPVFSLNSNKGFRHLMTTDGLYIAPVFRDTRLAPGLAVPKVTQGEDLAGYSLNDEAFLGSFQRGSDGGIYIAAGKAHHTIYKVQGLDSVRRFKTEFSVSSQQSSAAESYNIARQVSIRQAQLAANEAVVTRVPAPTTLEQLQWPATAALSVQQQNKTLFEAKMLHDQNNVYLAVKVLDDSPFVNGGDDSKLLFKTGDSINLELGALRESLKNTSPMPGDIRVLIAPFKGKPVVVIYRYKVDGIDKPVAFRSPAREVLVDRVEILDNLPVKVQTTSGGYTLFAALPKSVLGLPTDFSGRLFGDVGVVFSDPTGTVNNYACFWASPAKGVTSDVPSEIMLRPEFWKPFIFEK